MVDPATNRSSRLPRNGKPTIASALSLKRDNFDTVRLLAAWLVLLSHSWPIIGRPADEPLVRVLGYESLGGIAVSAFFVISGFLVTMSYTSDPHLGRYLAKRAIRIVPGLTVSALLCVALLGPAVTSLPLRDYFGCDQTWKYLRNASGWKTYYDLPGVFADQPLHAVNGSLWTLRSEWNMYLLLAAMGATRLLRPRIIMAGLLAMLAVHGLVSIGMLRPETPVSGIPLGIGLWHCFQFLGGSLLYQLRERIRLDFRCFLLCAAGLVLSAWLPHAECIFRMLLVYPVIYIALMPTQIMPWLRRAGDLSYGVYVYTFPVQQAIVYFAGTGIGVAALVATATAGTLVLAALSWHFVEKPALSLKRYLKPGLASHRHRALPAPHHGAAPRKAVTRT